MRAFIRAIIVLPLVVAGCQAIAGIEERHYQPVEAGVPVSAACTEYCGNVTKNCFAGNEVYTVLAGCQGICALLDEGNLKEPGEDNTVACRNQQAKNAGRVEPEGSCPLSGPGGGGTCGDDCTNYCTLYAQICADYDPLPNCMAACSALARSGHYNSQSDYNGDTLDCRLVHLSVATTGDKDMHCKHAGIPPTTPCSNDDKTHPPSCDDYCRVIEASCGVGGEGGVHAVYDSDSQCHKACEALPIGSNGDNEGVNSIGCRLYHSYNGFIQASLHCSHAGPTGQDVCVSKGRNDCDAYCAIAKKSCNKQYAGKYGTDTDADDQCVADCTTLKGVNPPGEYSIDTPDGDTFQCRAHKAVQAFDDPTLCDAAFGAAPCN